MSGIWGKAAPLFRPLKDDPKVAERAAWIRKWLAALVDGTKSVEEFDAAVRLSQPGRPGRERHMAQYLLIYGTQDEYYPVWCAQVDRRQKLRGLVYCPWRGWVAVEEFDACRWDRARERAAQPNKGEERRAA